MRNDGEAVFGDELPFGTVIELTEAAPAAISGGEWTAAEFDQSSITIGDETTVAVTLTNTFDADPTSGALPRTGMEPWVLIAAPIGAALIALGVVLAVRRRRVS